MWKMISGYLSSSAKVIFGTFVLFLVNIIWVLSSEISHVSTPSIFFYRFLIAKNSDSIDYFFSISTLIPTIASRFSQHTSKHACSRYC